MTERTISTETLVELSADEIAHVAGGSGLVGPGAGKDGGSTSTSGG